jgi:hypothetical protein
MLDRAGGDWSLCMFDFETYWDNSEPEPTTDTALAFPMAIAACYVSSKDQWDCFRRDWDRAREEEGFDVFHMTDFMASPCLKKPFCDWNRHKRDRVYYRLANIINTRVRAGFVFGVPSESYDLHTPQHIKDVMGNRHFTFAVRTVLSLVQEWYAKYGQGKAVQYIFDRMGKGKGEILQIFEEMKELRQVATPLGINPDDPDGFSFQNKAVFKPLQASDILAWNMRSHMRDAMAAGMSETTPPRLRPYFTYLRDGGGNSKVPIRVGFFRDRHLEQAAVDIFEYEEREGKPAFKATRRQFAQWRKSNAATE